MTPEYVGLSLLAPTVSATAAGVAFCRAKLAVPLRSPKVAAVMVLNTVLPPVSDTTLFCAARLLEIVSVPPVTEVEPV